MQFVGFDPGGESAFGWAVLEAMPNGLCLLDGGVVTGAPKALDYASKSLTEHPIAVGIDAPLFWALHGDRNADLQVRALVCAAGGQAGTVSHLNSLRGACLVQGVLAARLSHDLWPNAHLTEAHPKALLKLSGLARAFVSSPEFKTLSEHVRDAALAAYTAWAMIKQAEGWHDLARQEQSPFFPGGTEVAYWFPKQQTQ